MEDNAALFFGQLADEISSVRRGTNNRCSKMRQIDALMVRDVHVIMQMEIEFWHDR